MKTMFALVSISTLAAVAGCSAPADSSAPSADEALSSSRTLSLSAAEAQINEIRAKYDPSDSNALLFDPTLAQPYLNDVQPVFAEVAPKDIITLGGVAFTYTSDAINSGAVIDRGILDTAVADYNDLWAFTSYWGQLASAHPELWTKLTLLIGHATTGTLSDLQLLELVTNTNVQGSDVYTGLHAVNWSSAPDATRENANSLIAAESVYTRIDTLFFGQVDQLDQPGPAGGTDTFDIDPSDTFAVQVFTRSYSKLRLLSDQNAGGTTVDLGGHLASVYEYTGKPATTGIALAKSTLTASEMKEINEYVANE